MKRLTLDIDEETHREFRIQAATTGLTMVDLGRALIRDYLDADEARQGRMHELAAELKEAS